MPSQSNPEGVSPVQGTIHLDSHTRLAVLDHLRQSPITDDEIALLAQMLQQEDVQRRIDEYSHRTSVRTPTPTIDPQRAPNSVRTPSLLDLSTPDRQPFTDHAPTNRRPFVTTSSIHSDGLQSHSSGEQHLSEPVINDDEEGFPHPWRRAHRWNSIPPAAVENDTEPQESGVHLTHAGSVRRDGEIHECQALMHHRSLVISKLCPVWWCARFTTFTHFTKFTTFTTFTKFTTFSTFATFHPC
jgi:hypothetical protein